jgi:hypothetical protein
MAEERPDYDAGRAEPQPGRAAQTIEPAKERAAGLGRPADAVQTRDDEDSPPPPISTARGDIPEALKRRYFSEDGRAITTYFAGPGAKAPAFRDHGGKLSTHEVAPNTIRDMVAIAAHRGWRTLQVRGDDDFRREVWMEARALGLQVRGYRPRQRDEQELEARLAAQARGAIAPAVDRQRTGPRDPVAPRSPEARPEFDTGVRGILMATGVAPYRRRHGQPVTPFVRLDRGQGRALDIWGVGLTEALAQSGARVGDQILVRRDGVDRVQKTIQVRDPRTGETTRQAREVPRNRWTILAERFREASPAEAARDPDLKAAQSHLAVLKTVIQTTLRDPAGQARAYAAAREQVATRLDEGRQFRQARVEDKLHATDQGRPLAASRSHRAAPEAEHGPERTRRR